MVLFAIQQVRVVITSLIEARPGQTPPSLQVNIAFDIIAVIHHMLNVIIRSIHFLLLFVFLIISTTCLGHRTNNNFGADLNEIVL